MTERIDHVAKARGLEQNAWQKGGPDGHALIRTHEQRHDIILSAQVHATLALVEQQRIANLIALGEATFPDGSRIYSRAVMEPGEQVDSYRLRAEVREGLGL